MYILVCKMMFHRSLRLYALFFILSFFFFFCPSIWIVSIILSSHLQTYSACSNLSSNSSSEFSISLIVLFSSKISIWFLFTIFYPVPDNLILFIYHFLTSFGCLPMVSFNSLGIRETIDLK